MTIYAVVVVAVHLCPLIEQWKPFIYFNRIIRFSVEKVSGWPVYFQNIFT